MNVTPPPPRSKVMGKCKYCAYLKKLVSYLLTGPQSKNISEMWVKSSFFKFMISDNALCDNAGPTRSYGCQNYTARGNSASSITIQRENVPTSFPHLPAVPTPPTPKAKDTSKCLLKHRRNGTPRGHRPNDNAACRRSWCSRAAAERKLHLRAANPVGNHHHRHHRTRKKSAGWLRKVGRARLLSGEEDPDPLCVYIYQLHLGGLPRALTYSPREFLRACLSPSATLRARGPGLFYASRAARALIRAGELAAGRHCFERIFLSWGWRRLTCACSDS